MNREPNTPRGLARQKGHLQIICTSATCTRETNMMPLELIQQGYGDISLNAIEKRLKCRQCGAVRPRVYQKFW